MKVAYCLVLALLTIPCVSAFGIVPYSGLTTVQVGGIQSQTFTVKGGSSDKVVEFFIQTNSSSIQFNGNSVYRESFTLHVNELRPIYINVKGISENQSVPVTWGLREPSNASSGILFDQIVKETINMSVAPMAISPTTADFTVASSSNRNGYSPQTIQFVDLSSQNVVSWAWDFNNDGVVDSMISNPIHTFTTGTYSVRLTVSSPTGNNSQLKTNYIVVSNAPVTSSGGSGGGGGGGGGGGYIPPSKPAVVNITNSTANKSSTITSPSQPSNNQNPVMQDLNSDGSVNKLYVPKTNDSAIKQLTNVVETATSEAAAFLSKKSSAILLTILLISTGILLIVLSANLRGKVYE